MLLPVMLIALAQAAGAPASREVSTEGNSRPECVAVQVASPQQPPALRRPQGGFSATRILDLEFHTIFRRRLEGPHTLQLKVYTPRGHLYQVLTVPFAGPAPAGASGSQPPEKRWVDGYPQPINEQQAKVVPYEGTRRQAVTAKLPVAGTSIMTNSLYGEWHVTPHLDDDPAACGPSQSFRIGQ